MEVNVRVVVLCQTLGYDQRIDLMRDGKTWGLGSHLLMMQQMHSIVFAFKCDRCGKKDWKHMT